jgi:hypothetical protein
VLYSEKERNYNMKKILGCGCLAVVIILAGGGIFAWRILHGTVKQKDLGLHTTAEEALAAQQKAGVTVTTLPDTTPISESIRYEGTHPLSYSMNSQELSALALSHSKYKYFPFTNTQIRVNSDGTVEISSTVDTMRAFSYATAIGFAAADLEKAMNDFHIPRTIIPVYVKGNGSVINGKVTLNLDSGSVAGIPVPIGLVNERKPQIIGILEDGMNKTPGFKATSLTFSDGKMSFDGMAPEKKFIVE